ncbi:MAG: hypothetical protein ABGY96_18295 [bacterium]|nr:hypothetical protein [Gammaproteobacteria bacterium]
MQRTERIDQEVVSPDFKQAAEMVSIPTSFLKAANSTDFKLTYGLFGYFQIRAQFRSRLVRRKPAA